MRGKERERETTRGENEEDKKLVWAVWFGVRAETEGWYVCSASWLAKARDDSRTVASVVVGRLFEVRGANGTTRAISLLVFCSCAPGMQAESE